MASIGKTLSGVTAAASFLAATLAAPPGFGQTAPVAVAQSRSGALLDSWVADGSLPGAALAFGTRGSPPRFVSAGRIGDDGPAAGPDSLWRVYSMTKMVTAIAAMLLIEQGRISLDQPVADFIPAFRHMRVLVDPTKDLTSRPAIRQITIRHLLTHTAGLGYTIVTKGPLLAEYNRLGINPEALNANTEPVLRRARPTSLAEFADRVASLPLLADPGTRWSYSIGLDVLGRVIEVAGGMPFDQFVQSRIFDPLHMTSSYWTVPASEVGRLATDYLFVGRTRIALDPGDRSVFLQPPSFPYGGAGLVMSARDFDRLLAMMLNGGTLDGARILKPETVRLATSNLLPPGVTFLDGLEGDGAKMGFGAGGKVWLADEPGGPAAGSWGWSGAAGTVAWVDFRKGVRGTIMVNYMPANHLPLDEKLIPAIYRDLAR